jgi:hypothetical protein
MSIRGIRNSDISPGVRLVRVHLLRAGTEAATVCGDLPLSVEPCPDCVQIAAGGPLADRLAAGLAAGTITPCPHVIVRHNSGRAVMRQHQKGPPDASGVCSPLCGSLPNKLVPCALCLRAVEIHIRAPWLPDRNASVCDARELAPGFWISPEEAYEWAEVDDVDAEPDHPEIWRLCRNCETGYVRTARNQAANARRLATRAEEVTERVVRTEEAKLARREWSGGRKRSKRELPDAAKIDPKIAAEARRDIAAGRYDDDDENIT